MKDSEEARKAGKGVRVPVSQKNLDAIAEAFVLLKDLYQKAADKAAFFESIPWSEYTSKYEGRSGRVVITRNKFIVVYALGEEVRVSVGLADNEALNFDVRGWYLG